MSIFSPIGTGKHADACGNANVGRVLKYLQMNRSNYFYEVYDEE